MLHPTGAPGSSDPPRELPARPGRNALVKAYSLPEGAPLRRGEHLPNRSGKALQGVPAGNKQGVDEQPRGAEFASAGMPGRELVIGIRLEHLLDAGDAILDGIVSGLAEKTGVPVLVDQTLYSPASGLPLRSRGVDYRPHDHLIAG